MTNITIIIHTRDSEATLPRLLESVSWAEERIVVDMESRDGTCEIARQYGAALLTVSVAPRIDGIRNDFLERGRHEWVFVLDSDEYLAADAERAVNDLLTQYGKDYDAFAIPRYNMIAGRIVRGRSWYPDQQIRLFRKGCVRWSDTTHNPPAVLTGKNKMYLLEPPGCLHIHHENYISVAQLIERQAGYALNDRYPEEGFSFERYVADAYEEFGRRLDEKNDGELSFALATVMAWDKVIRGLIHWEQLGRKDSLGRAYSLPVTTVGRFHDYVLHHDIDQLDAEELRSRVRQLESQLDAGLMPHLSRAFGRKFPKAKNLLKRMLRKP